MKAALAILVLVFAATGCCKECVRTKSAGPKVEEYPLPPPPPK